jgi:hypothetical protein
MLDAFFRTTKISVDIVFVERVVQGFVADFFRTVIITAERNVQAGVGYMLLVKGLANNMP